VSLIRLTVSRTHQADSAVNSQLVSQRFLRGTKRSINFSSSTRTTTKSVAPSTPEMEWYRPDSKINGKDSVPSFPRSRTSLRSAEFLTFPLVSIRTNAIWTDQLHAGARKAAEAMSSKVKVFSWRFNQVPQNNTSNPLIPSSLIDAEA